MMRLYLPARANTWHAPPSPGLEKGMSHLHRTSQPLQDRRATRSTFISRHRALVLLVVAVVACTLSSLLAAGGAPAGIEEKTNMFTRIPWNDLRGIESQGLLDIEQDFADDKVFPGPEERVSTDQGSMIRHESVTSTKTADVS